MGYKGNQTRVMIKQQSALLFSGRGFKDVTMKDICEATGLSRGGLYRYFSSTAELFEEIWTDMIAGQEDEFARVMNYATPILEAEGIHLAYHNHSDEFFLQPWGSTIHSELEKRLICDFEIDTFWVWNAGADPLQTLERLKDRVRMIHLKDGLKGGVGRSLGEGEAPVHAVRDKAITMGLTMIVESENLSPDGLTEVTRCMEYLKSID